MSGRRSRLSPLFPGRIAEADGRAQNCATDPADRTTENPEPLHSTRMILVDRHGQIRGYYDAASADGITKLLADTNHLLKEQPR